MEQGEEEDRTEGGWARPDAICVVGREDLAHEVTFV